MINKRGDKMKKILCVADDEKANFYYITLSNIEECIELLQQYYAYQENRTVECEFLDSKHHTYGIYDDDIRKGNVEILSSKIIKKDKKRYYNKDEELVQLGLINVDAKYKSQVAYIIKQVFLDKKSPIVDFTKLIKVEHQTEKTGSNLIYDPNIDKGREFMTLQNPIYKYYRLNQTLYLNDKEKKMLPDEFKNIISNICDNSKLDYIGSIRLDNEYDEDLHILKSYAIRNSEIMTLYGFMPLRDKINSVDTTKSVGIDDIYNFTSYCDYCKHDTCKKLVK